MSFFGPPDPPPPPPSPAPVRPEWLGAPAGWLGGFVPLRIVLHRSDDLVIVVSQLLAYPAGLELTLEFRTRRARQGFLAAPVMARHAGVGGEELRFGVEFADGRRAIVGRLMHAGFDPQAPPQGPVLMPGGGGGDANRWDQRMWLWPLPPEGPLRFAIELPSADVPETVVEIDAAPIRAAALEAEQLWEPEPEPGGGGGWTSVSLAAVDRPDRPGPSDRPDPPDQPDPPDPEDRPAPPLPTD